MRENLTTAVQRRRRQYQHLPSYLYPGQLVWLYCPAAQQKTVRKLQIYWTGPWSVVKAISPVMYQIKGPATWTHKGRPFVVSVDRLKLYTNSDEKASKVIPPDNNHDVTMSADPFAERLEHDDEPVLLDEAPEGPPPGGPPPAADQPQAQPDDEPHQQMPFDGDADVLLPPEAAEAEPPPEQQPTEEQPQPQLQPEEGTPRRHLLPAPPQPHVTGRADTAWTGRERGAGAGGTRFREEQTPRRSPRLREREREEATMSVRRRLKLEPEAGAGREVPDAGGNSEGRQRRHAFHDSGRGTVSSDGSQTQDKGTATAAQARELTASS